MRKLNLILAGLAFATTPTLAQDFSEGSTARSWNLYAEQPATFEAKVVDMLCQLTGDCPADCGAGKRQMGLLRTADDVLLLGFKNNQPAFSGAAVDLAQYCNQVVDVDGLLIEDPDLGATNIYMVQKIRAEGGEWKKASQFTKVWAKENPEAKGKGPWFRRAPRIKDEIAKDGYLGLGLETDDAFIKEWF
ncbi:MAG: hypothetical protein ACU0BB_12345 [Paracoccaceae bacterium]